MERSVAADLVSRATAPGRVEADLAELWKEVAQSSHAVRAIMSNLVVVRERPATEPVDLIDPIDDIPLIEVARRHPCRLIVLVHERAERECRAPIDAAVTIFTFGTGESRHAVEQIAVRSRCADASLPSIVRRFTLGDLPTSVWWTGDLSPASPLVAMATLGRQFCYDSGRWRDVRAGFAMMAGLLDHPHAPDVADLNWRRLAPVRQAVARLLGRPNGQLNPPSAVVRVAHGPGDEALALLCAGWLGPMPESIAIEKRETAEALLTVSIGEAAFTMTRRDGDAEAIVAELQSLDRDVELIQSIRRVFARLAPRA